MFFAIVLLSPILCHFSGSSGREYILVMWYLYAAVFFYGMVGKEGDCCVRSGWFSVYVYFKFFCVRVILSGLGSLWNCVLLCRVEYDQNVVYVSHVIC